VVRQLLSSRLPGLAGLPLEPVRPQGTDNIVYRLGSELSVRLPRKLSAVPSLLIELDWLPQLAASLPLAVPVPVAAGEPDELYPFHGRSVWSAVVAAPAWRGPGVWTHRDLHGGKLLTTGARLTGVIDFGWTHRRRPGRRRDGGLPRALTRRPRLFRGLVGVDDATLTRARGLALCQGLEALPYYLDTHPGMVAFARRAIAATLGPQ